MADLDDMDLDPVQPPIWKNPAVLLLILAIVAGGGWFGYRRANPTAEDALGRGRGLLSDGDAEGATAAFEQALALGATGRNALDAHRGAAEAAERRGDHPGRTAWLRKAAALNDPALSPEDGRRSRADLAKAALAWANAVQATDATSPAREEALGIAAEADPQGEGPDLLAKHLLGQAELAAGRGDHGAAAAAARRVRGLEVPSAVKEKALRVQVDAEVAAFAPEFDKEFRARHEAELTASREFNPENRGFYVRVEVEIPRDPAVEVQVHEVTVMNEGNRKVREALLALLVRVAGAGADAAALKALPGEMAEWEQQTWTEGWVSHPTKYALGVVVDFPAATRLVWLLRNAKALMAPG